MTEHAQYIYGLDYMIAFQVAHRHNECSYNTIMLVYIASLYIDKQYLVHGYNILSSCFFSKINYASYYTIMIGMINFSH